jgi:hypothetical protein
VEDSNYHTGVRLSTGVSKARNAFYAIFLRHLWLGYGLRLGLEFVELTLGQEHSVNVLLRCISRVGGVWRSPDL